MICTSASVDALPPYLFIGRGLYRVHQFSKVEMFVLSTPEQSDALHQELIEIEQDMFTELGLHFQVGAMRSLLL